MNMNMKLRALMWILWPSFVVAAVTSAVVFALIDPQDVVFLDHLRADRQLVYTASFFFFWAMTALSSAFTLLVAPRPVVLDDFDEPV